jgi:predicted alpha/beta hydrolase
MSAFLARAGHVVITVDPRGHGQSLPHPKRGIDYSIDDIMAKDVAAVVAHAKAQYPELPRLFVGHSLGGHISAMYTAEHPEDVTALITLTTTHVYFRKLGLPSISLFLSFTFLTRILGYLPGQYVGWGTPMAKTQVLDWVRWGLTDRYSGSDGRDIEPAMARLRKPLLSIGFTDDKRLARPAGIDHFNALLPACSLTRWTLSPEELEVSALGHFDHLRTGTKVWARMDQWIRAQVQSAG